MVLFALILIDWRVRACHTARDTRGVTGSRFTRFLSRAAVTRGTRGAAGAAGAAGGAQPRPLLHQLRVVLEDEEGQQARLEQPAGAKEHLQLAALHVDLEEPRSEVISTLTISCVGNAWELLIHSTQDCDCLKGVSVGVWSKRVSNGVCSKQGLVQMLTARFFAMPRRRRGLEEQPVQRLHSHLVVALLGRTLSSVTPRPISIHGSLSKYTSMLRCSVP